MWSFDELWVFLAFLAFLAFFCVFCVFCVFLRFLRFFSLHVGACTPGPQTSTITFEAILLPNAVSWAAMWLASCLIAAGSRYQARASSP